MMKKEIIVTTGETIPGKKIYKILGVVRGNTVRARNLGFDILAGLKNMVGGEIKSYTDLISFAREEAYQRMVDQAKNKDADAIIGMRFVTSMAMQGASEMLAFGTAVKIK